MQKDTTRRNWVRLLAMTVVTAMISLMLNAGVVVSSALAANYDCDLANDSTCQMTVSPGDQYTVFLSDPYVNVISTEQIINSSAANHARVKVTSDYRKYPVLFSIIPPISTLVRKTEFQNGYNTYQTYENNGLTSFKVVVTPDLAEPTSLKKKIFGKTYNTSCDLIENSGKCEMLLWPGDTLEVVKPAWLKGINFLVTVDNASDEQAIVSVLSDNIGLNKLYVGPYGGTSFWFKAGEHDILSNVSENDTKVLMCFGDCFK